MPRSTRPILVDGDIYLYETVSACGYEYAKDEAQEDWNIGCDLKEVKRSFRRQMELLKEELTGEIIVALSDSSNFRKSIYADYKANRKNVRKPVGYAAAKAWVVEEYDAIIKPTLEADDVLGILSTKPGNEDAVIVSADKDLKSIPGRLYRNGEKIIVTPEEADRQWLLQTLTGDTTDNYPGCKGIGPVKAEAILAKPGDPWQNVVDAFLKAQLTEQDAIVQARLARILRWSDWDSDKQQPILWTPASYHRSLQPGDAEREVHHGRISRS